MRTNRPTTTKHQNATSEDCSEDMRGAAPLHSNNPRQVNIKQRNTHRLLSLQLLQASLTYFAVSVGAAAVLDTIRRKTLQVWFGKLVGVLAELPILFFIFQKASVWCTHKFHVPANLIPRLVMSTIALVLFVLVEMIMVTAAVDNMTCRDFFKEYVASFYQDFPSNLLGRLLEYVYAFMPLYQGLLEEKKRSVD